MYGRQQGLVACILDSGYSSRGGTVAKNASARRKPQVEDDGASARSPDADARRTRKTPVDLDRVIHERVRLAIVSALAGAQSLSFGELKNLLDLSDGNLSV